MSYYLIHPKQLFFAAEEVPSALALAVGHNFLDLE
jgi:hypothetical protein